MARPTRASDLTILLNGIKKLGSAALEVHRKEIQKGLTNSSLKPVAEISITSIKDKITSPTLQTDISKVIYETAGRLSVVGESIRAYAIRSQPSVSVNETAYTESTQESKDFQPPISTAEDSFVRGVTGTEDSASVLHDLDVSSTVGLRSAQELKQAVSEAQRNLDRKLKNLEPLVDPEMLAGRVTDEQLEAIDEKLAQLRGEEFVQDEKVFEEISSSPIDVQQPNFQTTNTEHIFQQVNLESLIPTAASAVKEILKGPKLIGRKPLSATAISRLSDDSQARRVPQSRLGRLASFGSLAAGLSAGTIAEIARRTLGGGEKGGGGLLDSSPFLTEANAHRIVDTLCRVRGAALKLGQMLSIQDGAMINPQLQKIFERVRQSADFMPTWQLERTLVSSFGDDWRSMVKSFEERPFAAASIGQVHVATLHDDRVVAMKIQYPGVARGIESDIDNLMTTLNFANILPEGLFVDNVVDVMKAELRWECDYKRERECSERYRKLVQSWPQYYVPEAIPQLCTKHVFTSELIDGIPVDQCTSLDQHTRNFIGEQLLHLCLRELFQFGFMQTDPNWSNFFYNQSTQQLSLLDFGACREFPKTFVDNYIEVIHGAVIEDCEKVYHFSKKIGFLTGYEAKIMVEAHTESVMILGEALRSPTAFHFGQQDISRRIQAQVPLMIKHRMSPPPKDTYSLHRKMSGVFLLCAKLDSAVSCKSLFEQLYDNYDFESETWPNQIA